MNQAADSTASTEQNHPTVVKTDDDEQQKSPPYALWVMLVLLALVVMGVGLHFIKAAGLALVIRMFLPLGFFVAAAFAFTAMSRRLKEGLKVTSHWGGLGGGVGGWCISPALAYLIMGIVCGLLSVGMLMSGEDVDELQKKLDRTNKPRTTTGSVAGATSQTKNRPGPAGGSGAGQARPAAPAKAAPAKAAPANAAPANAAPAGAAPAGAAPAKKTGSGSAR